MLAGGKLQALQSLIEGSSTEELIWINGYLNGLLQQSVPAMHPVNGTTVVTAVKTHVLYGTETGNAKKLAIQLSSRLRTAGISAPAIGLDQFKIGDLEKPCRLLVIVSTQGEGEPPANARKFFDQLTARRDSYADLEYAILGLGDSSYPLFNKTAEDLDQLLRDRNGRTLLPLVRCDVDFEEPADTWFHELASRLGAGRKELSAPVTAKLNGERKAHAKKTYSGKVQTHIKLNDHGSAKSTWHIEVVTDEPVVYEPGDALALIPKNREALVDRILVLAGADPEFVLETPKYKGSLKDLLTEKLSVCHLLASVMKKYAALAGHEIPDVRMDLVDLLRIYPLKDPASFPEVVKSLSVIAPRLYSISSSPKVNDQEVHLTVSHHRFLKEGEELYGLCSSFLGDQETGSTIHFHIHQNRAFKLPEPERDIIMIGPGTGIAPFRSFLQERDATGATGKNWFFFGEQHFRTDFLYQAEIQQYHATGLLQEVSLAFSRDQPERIYVQHRLLKRAHDLWAWLQNGAAVYVSGTKHPMSDDVEQTLVQIIGEQGGMDQQQAQAWLGKLKEEGRYQKDVY